MQNQTTYTVCLVVNLNDELSYASLEQNLYRVYERRKEMSSLTPPYKRLMSYR